MTTLFVFILIIALVLFAIFIIQIPIMIARGRGISGGDLTTIVILSWLGILLGVTWFAALVLSFVWGSGQGAPRDSADVDRLEKLHKLYKSNAITKQEYDAEKKKILGK